MLECSFHPNISRARSHSTRSLTPPRTRDPERRSRTPPQQHRSPRHAFNTPAMLGLLRSTPPSPAPYPPSPHSITESLSSRTSDPPQLEPREAPRAPAARQEPTIGDLVAKALSLAPDEPEPASDWICPTPMVFTPPPAAMAPHLAPPPQPEPPTKEEHPHARVRPQASREASDLSEEEAYYARQREELLRQIEETKLQLAMENDHLWPDSEDPELIHAQRGPSPPRMLSPTSEEEEECSEYDSFLRAQQETRQQRQLDDALIDWDDVRRWE
eukprot:NODE_1306_length_1197_cov_40.006098_g1074_i0.p1 GENE.NODE_1306_length_1197_cov_40.006098_g1074_i0~~NODE_1306_length_1197_cov_40.006098_g1074_i0.p1  ORF type:complete len:298 (+),score=96.39 NODE_1306_length_1197_cov_40.006098_g1074_i0:79-894(+)